MVNQFTTDYQFRLLALLCLDKDFFLSTRSLLDETYFSTFIGQWLYKEIKEYNDKYNALPTRIVIENKLAQSGIEVLPEETLGFQEFLGVLTAGTVVEAQYVRETTVKFAASRKIRLALGERELDIDEGNVDGILEAVRDVSKTLIKRSTLEDPNLFSLRNLREIYESAGAYSTGITMLDRYIGGLYSKELTLILADTNVGKSFLLVAIGAHLVRQGKKVLHVTLEMSIARTLIRYMTALIDPTEVNITYTNILTLNPMEEVVRHSLLCQERYQPFLAIEELPTGIGTLGDIERLMDKHNAEVVIVDYLDLIKPTQSRDQKRFELGDLATQLRGLGVQYQIPVLTATQAARTAANRRLVGKEFVAEDYEKVRVSDVVIGMGRNRDDINNREVVFYLTKSRNTEVGRVERYMINYDLCRFIWLREEIIGGDE